MVVKCTFFFIWCNSIRTESLQPITAHLLAAYTDIFGLLIMPASDAILQICPSFTSNIGCNACSASTIGAIVFTPKVSRTSAIVLLLKVWLPRTIPAQFISTPTRSNFFSTSL